MSAAVGVLSELPAKTWDLFWAKVDTSGDCWVWTGTTSAKGYGLHKVYLGGGRAARRSRTFNAHRLSLLWTDCPPTAEQVVDHRCRNTRCVNPAHLEAVTPLVNTRRGGGNVAKTRCPRNHLYDTVTKAGSRRCSVCDAAWEQTHRRAA